MIDSPFDVLSGPIGFVLGILLLFAIFLAIREIVMWYWKINRIVDLLEDIEYNTRKEKEKGDTDEDESEE
ncbi:MAG: hypothetical protein RL681_244 [Candidatus Parcubacteria bacterium]